MVKTVDIECTFVEPGTHKVIITPLWNGENSIDGAVGVGGVVIGKNEIPVSGFPESETVALRRALRNYDHVYLKIGLTDKTNYRIVKMIETAGVATKFVVYPPVQADAVADDVIKVAGKDIKIDIGMVGEDAIKLEGTIEVIERKDEAGATHSEFVNLQGVKGTVPALTMTRENFLLIMPKSFYVVKDGVVSFAMGLKKGFQKSPNVRVEILSKDDPEDMEKRIFFETAIMSSKEFTLSLGKDTTKAFPITFSSNGNNLVLIGDETATYATV
ncbi:MAG: hypothetical protein A2015_10700 [Spirochaetes bacterium GWF1_31_7]|nr:MAG: hypothetical protein A2015_10700 [Spirochaetes bacterium GWF1_31_7]HBD93512.1 hypothetical protein [Spirochaetia bacterium]HBI37049.1 hypothetical protein [Spirochaetia bacterium]